MKYRILSPRDEIIETYSSFVRSHGNCHFLQDPAWGRVKNKWKWAGVLATDDAGNIMGALSILLRPLPAGFHIAYAPRGPVCDRGDWKVLQTLAMGMDAIAKEKKCLLTYLDPDESEENLTFRNHMRSLGFQERKSDDFGGVQPQSVFRLPLQGKGEEALLASFAQKTRYNIRLAQRKGLEIRKYTGENTIPEEVLHSFGKLMKTTGERDRFLVRPESYFAALLQCLGKYAALYLACLEGEPIAGTLAIFYGDKAWYLYGASSNEHRGAMPNYLLQWTMIRDAITGQCTLYDFRGVPGTGEPEDPLYGLYRFKKGFGGVHTRFAGLYIRYHIPVFGRLFDFGQSVFRKLRRKLRSGSQNGA